ncbi:MAG: 5'/3'-nucleotidase SurE [Pseudomonadales bacterium]|nr:5'/3'-nucleotidase SurE [Pseudomonadales bacterium]
MSLLLSNDDGVYAPGLLALEACLKADFELKVIAPSRDRSGVSNSITLDRPLHTELLANNFIAVDGTPTDCVHLGTAEIFMPIPQRVISGINLGANLGDDVLYSGTVAAAMEGRFLAKAALAVSLTTSKMDAGPEHFMTAATIVRQLIPVLDDLQASPRTVFNINIPDLPADRIKGFKLTVLGQRLRGENPIKAQNPRGKTLYWIGRAGGPVAAVAGTDFHAVANGYVSITPIHADMTYHASVPAMSQKLEQHAARLCALMQPAVQELI